MSQRYAMMEEINEQVSLLRGLFEQRDSLCREFVSLTKKHHFKKVLFVGNGSPYYAGYTLTFAAEKLLGAEAESIPAGIFGNHREFDRSGTFHPDEILLVCPAESGHSKGQVDAARRARAQGICVMSTTLNPQGILAKTSDVVLGKPGKHEVAMAATKGQTMAIYMIFLNFLEAAYQNGKISGDEYARYLSACEKVPDNVEKTIHSTVEWFSKNRKRVMDAGQYFLLGFGANYGTVQEAGLKFFECHGKPSMPLELEESLHGPFRGLGKKDMAFFVAAEEGAQRERMLTLADAVKFCCDNRIILQNANREARGDILPVYTSDVEFINAVEYLIPFQVLAFLIADALDIDLTVPLVAELDDVMLPAYEDD